MFTTGAKFWAAVAVAIPCWMLLWQAEPILLFLDTSDEVLVEAFRVRALITGSLAGVTAVAGAIVVRSDAREFDVGLHRHFLDPMKPFARVVLEPAHGVMLTSATLRRRRPNVIRLRPMIGPMGSCCVLFGCCIDRPINQTPGDLAADVAVVLRVRAPVRREAFPRRATPARERDVRPIPAARRAARAGQRLCA